MSYCRKRRLFGWRVCTRAAGFPGLELNDDHDDGGGGDEADEMAAVGEVDEVGAISTREPRP